MDYEDFKESKTKKVQETFEKARQGKGVFGLDSKFKRR
jgi:hypothetical protein